MKVAVIGAGALGCLFGAKFSQENEVIMITHKQSEADVINDHGLILKATDDKLYQYENVKAL